MYAESTAVYIYSSDPFSHGKVREATLQKTLKNHSEGPLSALPNCLLQLKVSLLLLPRCAGESPLTLHYLVSPEWAL